MTDEILVRFSALDPRRQYMFIAWLQAHSSLVGNAANIQAGLTAWLGSMQHENVMREYRLILDEIAWWDNLDERSLAMLMLADLARSGAS